MKSLRSPAWLWGAALLLAPQVASAHERFIPHMPKYPICEEYFQSFSGPGHNMLIVSGITFLLLGTLMSIWFLRDPLDDLVENKILRNLRGRPRDVVHFIASFITDKPIELPWWNSLSEWFVILFLRIGALVLMFAAANKSLVMTSYPLEPSNLALFQFAQVAMGVGMLTQTFLPLGGATIFGTFLYLLFAYDWKASVDVLPVLTVAVVYMCAPWDSWKRPITSINRSQMRWVRIILGFGFFVLGWVKIYNYYLTIGVADNFPSVMSDPMIKMFSMGTDPTYFRENWLMAFAMAEVMTGFMLMMGIFCRFWCLLMVYVFTKLMLVDFGWDEIPHLYPIGAFCVVLFSNNLSDEFYRIEEKGAQLARVGKTFLEAAVSIVSAFAIAFLAVFPMLYYLTTVPHPDPYFTKAEVAAHCAALQNHTFKMAAPTPAGSGTSKPMAGMGM